MTALYPLRFRTIYKDKIWGGEKIRTVLGKDFSPLPNCGETWELSAVEGNVSEVSEGPLAGRGLDSLIAEYRGSLVGESVYARFGNDFPLLVKFIDANQDLSIQVHPDDAMARERHGGFGKTEMWYILQADPGSSLISGFNRALDKESYLRFFEAGKLPEILNREQTEAGDVFFLPAGRVHTIGKGLLLAEIQQSSDITYRIYDFERRDGSGQLRELHVEEAVDAIDYRHYPAYKTSYDAVQNEAVEIARSPYFHTHRLELTRDLKRDLTARGSCVVLIVADGRGEMDCGSGRLQLQKGDVLLIPAETDAVTYLPDGDMTLLEASIPD